MKLGFTGTVKRGFGGDECYAGKMGFFILFCFFITLTGYLGWLTRVMGYIKGWIGCVLGQGGLG